LVLLAVRVIDHAPHYDELLHMLSARGMLQTGQPTIADGVYIRAELFTRAVAWSLGHFGDSLIVARLPALAGGALLVFIVGVWVARRAGMLTGALAAMIVCLIPSTLDVAVFARFYTVHAALMMLMFICSFEVMQPGRAVWVRVACVTMLPVFIVLGWHFQDTTIIAVGAAATAVLSLAAFDHWVTVRAFFRRRPALTIGTVVLAAIVAIGALWSRGLFEQFRMSPLWAAGNVSRHQYYLVEFRKDLPLFWPMLPVLTAVALAFSAQKRLALFCSVAAVSALLVHTFAAQKLLRYVFYLVPLMCVLWAIGLANSISLAVGRDAAAKRDKSRQRSAIAIALLAIAILLSQEGARALNLLAGRDAGPGGRPFATEPDWTSLVPGLAPIARTADSVVTSNSMKALFYLGRYDYELNATIVPETETRAEFGRDRRTGRQAIGTAESIRKVLERPGSTLVVIEASKIGRSSGVSTEAFSVIESHCDELSLPEGSGVRAWSCVAEP
jgi:hypothetical protein